MTARHALIVEDNRSNIQVLATLLDQQSITSTGLADPTRLTDTLQELDHLDLVFLDLVMPYVNGYQVLEMLRGLPEYAHLPVIAYSVYVSQLEQAYAAGFDSFLAKPLDPVRFPGQIARILNGEGVWERF
ncbi:MAG: response regulator [Anaerolineae bacterium]